MNVKGKYAHNFLRSRVNLHMHTHVGSSCAYALLHCTMLGHSRVLTVLPYMHIKALVYSIALFSILLDTLCLVQNLAIVLKAQMLIRV